MFLATNTTSKFKLSIQCSLKLVFLNIYRPTFTFQNPSIYLMYWLSHLDLRLSLPLSLLLKLFPLSLEFLPWYVCMCLLPWEWSQPDVLFFFTTMIKVIVCISAFRIIWIVIFHVYKGLEFLLKLFILGYLLCPEPLLFLDRTPCSGRI